MLSIATQVFSPLVNAGSELVTTVTKQTESPSVEERVRTAVRCGAIPSKTVGESSKKLLDSGIRVATTTFGVAKKSLVNGYCDAQDGAKRRRKTKANLDTPVLREAWQALAFGGDFLGGAGTTLVSSLSRDGKGLVVDLLSGAVSAGSSYGGLLSDPFLTPVTAVVGATAYELNQVVRFAGPLVGACLGSCVGTQTLLEDDDEAETVQPAAPEQVA